MPHQSDRQGEQKIRLLTFNIQAGTSTARYHHYVTHSWRQVLPHTQRVENLDAIAAFDSIRSTDPAAAGAMRTRARGA